MTMFANRLDPPKSPWLQDPAGWVGRRLTEHVTVKQKEIMDSVVNNKHTVVHSSNSIGKSFSMARLAAWWIENHGLGEAFVVSTAPTWYQVETILWKELARAHRKGMLSGRISADCEWKINMGPGPDELVAYGRKPADYDEGSFLGIHARYVLVIIDEACHDDQTDVMTEFGWMRFADLTGKERLLTMDPVTHKSTYRIPEKIIRKHYSGDMLQYGGNFGEKGADFCVTPDHDMYYTTRNLLLKNEWKRTNAENLTVKEGYLKRDIEWNALDESKHTIPACVTSGRYSDIVWPELTVEMDDWIELLGWWCSEGNVFERRGIYRSASITQSKDSKVLDRIEELCSHMQIGPTYRYHHEVRISNAAVAKELGRFGRYQTERRIPNYVRQLSVRQIRIFLDAYLKGDGTVRKGNSLFYTSSKHMADDLQELVLKLGRPSVVAKRFNAGQQSVPMRDGRIITSKYDGYVVTYPKMKSNIKLYKRKWKKIPYDGMVYCARISPEHLLFTRRNGYTLWSGNCGVAQGIYDAAESLATNDLARIVAVGNPDDPSSYFEKICQPGSGWNVIHADAFKSPNFTAEEVNKYPAVRALMIREGIAPSTEPIPRDVRDLLVTPSWANERIKRWGAASPLFTSRVRGQFPTVTNNTLIHPHWVSLACAREMKASDVDPWLGVDVARYGTDHSIIVLRRGGHLRVIEDISYGPITELAGKVQLHGLGRINTPIANIDDTGVGGGVTDILMEEGYPVHALISSAACSADEVLPNGKPRFFNARSEWWWRMREWLAGYSGTGEDGRLDLDPEDEELIAQLTCIRYSITSQGQIKVESKDDMRSRRLPSPDRGDAAVYSLVPTKTPSQMMPNLELMVTGDLLEKKM
jgi:hypothetical protein